MSSNEDEDPLQNSSEKNVVKEIEKKAQNSDHNETESQMDDIDEFFDADCNIPNEANLKESDALGKESSPKKDSTTLENDERSGNERQNDSKKALDAIEKDPNEGNIIDMIVDNTDNLASKSNVVDETTQVQLVDKTAEVCTTLKIKQEMINERLSTRVGGTITLDSPDDCDTNENVSENANENEHDNVDIDSNTGTNKQYSTTATNTINHPGIDDGKDDNCHTTNENLSENANENENENENVDIDSNTGTNKQSSTTATNTINRPGIDDGKESTVADVDTVKYSFASKDINTTTDEDTDTAQTRGGFLSPTLPTMMNFEPTTPRRGNSSHGGKQIPIPPPGNELVIPPRATIAGGSYSKIYMEDVVNEVGNKKNLKDQRGLSNCSGLFCPNIYLYEHYTVEEKMKTFDNEKGPYALGKIVQVPNIQKMIETYTIKYDDIHDEMDGWVTELPRNKFVKECLQQGILRANKVHWRLVTRKRITKQKSKKPTNPPPQNGTVLLSGILEEDHQSFSSDKDSEQDDTLDRDYVPPNPSSSSSTSSDDDETSQCDMEDSAYIEGSIPTEIGVDDEKEAKSNESTYLGNEWTWDSWDKHDINDPIPGPEEHDRYDGPHGLKSNLSKRFCTVLQCLFETTSMNRKFFLRVAGESNKYARKIMKQRSTTLFLGHKWSNISVEEMVHFFGILLRISLEPRKMGGYESYFTENQSLTLASGYTASLRGYNAWAKDIMSLVRFKQIRSAFRSECHRYDINDKCYQLRWFIRHFNYMAKKTFDLGPNASFDEGGIAMRSRFCPVRQYNKDKPAKYRVDFFILADSRDYFIYHLDVYQGANQANIDIHPSIKHLPTTQKAVANAILKSGIDNDKDGCRYLFMDNRYAAPQLFALMLTNYNIRAVGTCKANRVGFESEALKLPSNAKRGDYMRLVDKRLGMVTTRWKDSKNLQTVSTVMKSGSEVVKRRVGSTVIDVQCPSDIVLYQKNMGGVDRGDQHRVIGAGFANVAHFKKWFKKAFFGIADFCLLQAFTAWNLSVDQITKNRRGNSEVKRKKVVKWEFYSVLAEELMMYVDTRQGDPDDGSSARRNSADHFKAHAMKGHVPAPFDSFDRKNIIAKPLCMMCSMDEMAKAQVFQFSHSKSRIRKISRRTKYLVQCMHEGCNIVAHSCIPQEGTKFHTLPAFAGLTCFEIAHHPRCIDLFARIERQGKWYNRTIPSHSIVQETKELYEAGLPRRSNRERRTTLRSKAGRPPSVIDTSNIRTPENELDSITAATGLETSEFFSIQSTPDEPIRPRRTIQRKKAEPRQPTRRSTRTKHNISVPLRKSRRNKNINVASI